MNCMIQHCACAAEFHITDAKSRRAHSVHHLCDEHARVFFSEVSVIPDDTWTAPLKTGEIEIDLERIVISETNEQQLLYLRVVNGHEQFPLLVGIFEATAIERTIQGFKAPRPLTHTAMASVIKALNGSLTSVALTELRNHVYYAELRIRHGNNLVSVDLRPSDAIALALEFGAPILIARDVLDEVLTG